MTRVELFNRVLNGFGYRRIDDPDDTAEEVVRLNELYPQALIEVLSLRDWGCSIRYAQLLPREEEDPIHKRAYAYDLPVDPECLRVMDCYTDGSGERERMVRPRFEVEGNTLYSVEPIDAIRYKAYIEVEAMDRHVANLLVARLSFRAAVPLKGSMELQQAKEQDFENLYIIVSHEENKITGFDRQGMEPHTGYQRRPRDASQRFVRD